MILEISAIIATGNRPEVLSRTIHSMAEQSHLPKELIVVDASGNNLTKELCLSLGGLSFQLIYVRANEKGAAHQRIQGVSLASQPVIWFLDDDIILEDSCTERVWKGFNYSANVGAVNAMITNQHYTTPGLLTRSMYWLMHGEKLSSYAGKIIGPAWNLLPEDEPGLPEYSVCEWLNSTCTMYKKEALPVPVFPSFFTGYSLMEDVALSVIIGRTYTLLNARTARIYHDSQPGDHKNNVKDISKMALVNRYLVMTKILNRSGFSYTLKLFLLELFGITTSLRNRKAWNNLPAVLGGKISAILKINAGG